MKQNWIGQPSDCVVVGIATLFLSVAATVANAQQASKRCSWLCTPSVTLMPAMLRTHLFGGPTVESMSTGAEHRLASTSSFEFILAVASKTRVPRVSVFGSLQWLPNA